MATLEGLETENTALRKQIAYERELTEQSTAAWQATAAEKNAELAAFQKAAQERETELKAACPHQESGFSINVSFTGKVINGGQVTFEPVDGSRTRITLNMQYEPDDFVESAGDVLGFVSRRVQSDLERFKEFIQTRGHETGAWRGSIRAG